MTTFEKMKENMILNQFLPGLVKNEVLLKVFKEVDREEYLDNHYKHMAYSDFHIKVSDERYFISPFSLAKMLDKANLNPKDVVMLIGSGNGYESEILSKISSTVIAIEESLKFYKFAENKIITNQIENVINVNGSFLSGCKKYAPYDIILILGSLNRPSEELFKQLSKDGKLMVCENYNNNFEESRLFMYTKINKKIFKEYICDLNLPKLILTTEEKTSFTF